MAPRKRFSRGQALVETGMIISLLLVLTFMVVDMAGLFWVILAFQNGVNQATRFAITGNTISPLSRDQSILTALRAQTPGFTINDGDVSFFNVSTNSPGSGGPNDIIKVTVVHDWRLFSPLVQPLFNNGSITIQVTSTMKNEPPATS